MEVQLRPIVDDEVEAFVLANAYGFGERWQTTANEGWSRAELDRTVAAFVDDDIVATGRNYTLEVTMPGGGTIPAGGVTWISTRPTHRRRGLLTRVMATLVADSRERGELVSILSASEAGIYPRFGYGVATRIATVRAERSAVQFLAPPPEARVHMVEPPVAAELAPRLFDRIRRVRTGAVSRPDRWWTEEWAPHDWIDPKQRFDVVVEISGEVVGYAMYAIEGDWKEGFSEKVVALRDFIAATTDAEAALWHYLFNIDQTVAVRAWNRPIDDGLPWLLTDSREIRTVGVRDFLWLRPIDTTAFLAARTYGAAGELVLEVTDRFLGDEPTVGRFRLVGGPDGATCVRTDADPDLLLDAAELGSISLGGFRPSQLVRAGRIVATDPAAASRADAMFVADREPQAMTWF